MRRAVLALVLTLTATLGGLAWASPATAATLDQRLALVTSFTQPTTVSHDAWDRARTDQGGYADYGLDWSTDYCSDSPDEPLGFDFRMPCWRHDFGYRNYKHLGQFSANKAHVDSAFYFDLKAKCARYPVVVRPACYSLAWTYYQAVRDFGAVVVRQDELNRAAAYQADLQRQAVGDR